MKFKIINKYICKLLGHKPITIYESRYRSDGTKKKKYRFFGYSIGQTGYHSVIVKYSKCKRCGKKLTNAKRLYYG